MKKLILIFFLFIPAVLADSCIVHDGCDCIVCEIYDEFGYYIEDYGRECGDSYDLDRFAEEADDYAWYVYGGFAECFND
ncbi:MAG: hypothetical protein JXR41_00825 [Bacteroidales bacterium]|nr:hypothetical protein [Bacteroidales bacterium]MBN2761604.1 hypothetical protein [Bacteroidales bacterium]